MTIKKHILTALKYASQLVNNSEYSRAAVHLEQARIYILAAYSSSNFIDGPIVIPSVDDAYTDTQLLEKVRESIKSTISEKDRYYVHYHTIHAQYFLGLYLKRKEKTIMFDHSTADQHLKNAIRQVNVGHIEAAYNSVDKAGALLEKVATADAVDRDLSTVSIGYLKRKITDSFPMAYNIQNQEQESLTLKLKNIYWLMRYLNEYQRRLEAAQREKKEAQTSLWLLTHLPMRTVDSLEEFLKDGTLTTGQKQIIRDELNHRKAIAEHAKDRKDAKEDLEKVESTALKDFTLDVLLPEDKKPQYHYGIDLACGNGTTVYQNGEKIGYLNETTTNHIQAGVLKNFSISPVTVDFKVDSLSQELMDIIAGKKPKKQTWDEKYPQLARFLRVANSAQIFVPLALTPKEAGELATELNDFDSLTAITVDGKVKVIPSITHPRCNPYVVLDVASRLFANENR